MLLEDLPMSQRSVKLPFLRLTFSSSSKLEIAQGSTRSGHDFLKLLLLLVPKVVLLLVVVLTVVVLVSVVVLIGRVEFLPFGAVGDEVDGVATLKTTP
jgi:hypothetical protein